MEAEVLVIEIRGLVLSIKASVQVLAVNG